MAVKDLDKKLNTLAEPASAKAVSDAKWRRENKDWLAKSFDIALGVLSAMKAKDWNQKRLAEEMGVSTQQVSKIVKGKENFTLQTIAKLEQVLNERLMQTAFSSDIQIASYPVVKEVSTPVSKALMTVVCTGETQILGPKGELKNESQWTDKKGIALKAA